MQIDWITVAAQAANFLVLVWLLQRFLYRPIVRAMDRREQRIAERMRAAESREAEAEEEAERYRKQQAELEDRRDAMMAEAEEAAETERRKRERAAREDVEARKRRWQEQLESERDQFLADLRRQAAAQFYRLARRALGDLADAELEARIAQSFARQLEGLDDETRDKVAAACAEAGDTVTIRSRFELASETRESLARAVRGRISENAEITHEVDETVICGIELRAGSQTVRWSIASYLDDLENAVGEQVAGTTGSISGQAAE